MDKLFGDLKKFFKKSPCVIDSFVFRLHYLFTLVVLLAFSIAVTGKAYVGDPISCISKDDIPTDLLNTYCWISSTFSVVKSWKKEVGREIPYPGVDKYTPGEPRVYHAYYQWVAFVLFLQAMLFYVPRYLWRNAEHERIQSLVMEFNSPVVCVDPGKPKEQGKNGEESVGDKEGRDPEKKAGKKDMLENGKEEKQPEKYEEAEKVSKKSGSDEEDKESAGDDEPGTNKKYLIKRKEVKMTMVKNSKEEEKEPDNVVKTKLLLEYLENHKHKHTFYGAMYTLATVLNFVNVVGQMYLINVFLGGEFTSYGTEVISFTEWDYSVRYDPMIRVFPRMTKCTFYRYGSSGDPQKHDAMCLLPINILNEKIYVFLWFWFVILAVLSGLEMVYRAGIIFSSQFRLLALKSRCRTLDPSDLKIIVRHYDCFDWLVFSLLCKNMTPRNFRAIITLLSQRICEHKSI